jgi:di/tricarboxylate transporter
MGWEGWFSLAVVLACFGMLAFSWVAADIVLTAGLSLLLVSGVVSPEQALAGFSNPGMLTVAVLYVVVSGLTETGAVVWLVQSLLGRPRHLHGAQLRLMLPVATLSAFLNNTPVVAVFVPAVKDWARRNGLPLSKLLIPLSYASIAGGTCTLIGTSTNLVVNGLLTGQAGHPGLRVLELAWIGLPLVTAVVLFVVFAGRRLLPDRNREVFQPESLREYTVEMLVPQASPLIGRSVEQAGLRALPGLFLVEIDRGAALLPAVSPQILLQAGDRLVFAGAIDSVMDLQRTRGLLPATDQLYKLEGPRQNRCFVEAVVSGSCPLVGKKVRDGRFRSHYGAVIIALARDGERLVGKIGDRVLRAGDTLLLETRPLFLEQQRNSRDFFLVSEVGDHRPVNQEKAGTALAVAGLMVVLAATGWLSMLESALVAAGLMLVSGCTSGSVARRAPDWQVLVVIATSFGIGAALQGSGAAGVLATALIGTAGGEPWLTLALVFLVTALLTAVATNNVAAVLVFPIAAAAADAMQVSILPFAVTIMVAASASFATPIGYQTNLMVYSAGGYRFGDFLRIGLPLTLMVGVITIGLVPLIWGF